MTEPNIAIGVLLYVNRSGSTLLSRMISDGCDGAFVFPEIGCILEMLVAAQAGRVVAGERLCRLIEDDPRRSALTVSSLDLTAICRDHSTNDIGALLVAIATAECGQRPSAILMKHERFADLAHSIADVIPDAHYIHIIRDPRAVVSSMLRTPVPEKPGFNMARGSALFAARHWRRYVQGVEALAKRHPVLELRFEDLGGGAGSAACAGVANVLGVRLSRYGTANEQAGRYRIAALDHALHGRIHRPFDVERTDGWRAELVERDIRLIEAICGNVMRRNGYAPVTDATSFGRLAFAAARLRHLGAMARHIAGTARHYARRPDPVRALRMHLGLMIGRLCARR